MKKPALKDLKAAHPELPQHELNKLYTRSKIRYVDTREKRSRVELAKERGQLVEKKLPAHYPETLNRRTRRGEDSSSSSSTQN
jgi:hypothetical protein